MPWSKISRDDLFQGSDSPFISITPEHFRFNVLFARQAGLDSSYRVTIFEDEENRRLAFEFQRDPRPDSYALTSKKDTAGGLYCSNKGVVQNVPGSLRSLNKRGRTGDSLRKEKAPNGLYNFVRHSRSRKRENPKICLLRIRASTVIFEKTVR